MKRQIGLRNRDVPIVKNKEAEKKSFTGKPKRIPPPKDASMDVINPEGKEKKNDNPRRSDQGYTYFSLEDEIEKIKIFVPLIELLKILEYYSKIAIVLKPTGEFSSMSDSLNLQEEVIFLYERRDTTMV